MKTALSILLLTFSFLCQTFACINGEGLSLKDGTLLYEDGGGRVPYGHSFNYEAFSDGIKRLDSLYKATKDFNYLSDKGVLLILLKKYDEAINLYLEIEKKQPNRYSTASNIGTAYELAGQNENALKWIKRAVEINPKSHFNSEWIHVKILEAKIKGEQFYTSDFLLNMNFGPADLPASSLSGKQLYKLSGALYYQLNERVSFVKPKEKIVARLLFDLGNIAFLLGEYSNAEWDYKRAKEYGFTGRLIDVRIEESIKMEKKHPSRHEEAAGMTFPPFPDTSNSTGADTTKITNTNAVSKLKLGQNPYMIALFVLIPAMIYVLGRKARRRRLNK
jgi:hypothetical protein